MNQYSRVEKVTAPPSQPRPQKLDFFAGVAVRGGGHFLHSAVQERIHDADNQSDEYCMIFGLSYMISL